MTWHRRTWHRRTWQSFRTPVLTLTLAGLLTACGDPAPATDPGSAPSVPESIPADGGAARTELAARAALAEASLRIGLGRFTTEAEVDYAAGRIAREVRRLRNESGFSMEDNGLDRLAEAAP